MKELWRQQPFRMYWLGMFLSGLGDQFGWMGLTWFVMKKTGSSAAMGGRRACVHAACCVCGAGGGSFAGPI
ncbi:hypothetical protein [Brevibacillus gelatini]